MLRRSFGACEWQDIESRLDGGEDSDQRSMDSFGGNCDLRIFLIADCLEHERRAISLKLVRTSKGVLRDVRL